MRIFTMALLVGLLVASIPVQPAESALYGRITWEPRQINAQTIAPAAIPEPGASYTVDATLTTSVDLDAASIESRARGITVDVEPSELTLAAGESADVAVTITLPERLIRSRVYYGRLVVMDGYRSVPGTLPVYIRVPTPKLSWNLDSSLIRVGAGQTIATEVGYSSDYDLSDLELLPTSLSVAAEPLETSLTAGDEGIAVIEINAPVTSVRRTQSVIVRGRDNGVLLLNPLRLRLFIEPIRLTWSERVVDVVLEYGEERNQTLTITSNLDVEDLTLFSLDLGIMTVEPAEGISLQAGEPREIDVALRGFYAPSRYFIWLQPRIGRTAMRPILPIRVTILDPFADAFPG